MPSTPSLTKDALISAVADRANISKAAANAAIAALTDIVVDRARIGEETRLHKFGCFVPKTRKARACHNPANGEPIQIGERVVLGFKPSNSVNELLA